jgi:transcriptional regulator with GAF, ATPase, and Fis domain
LEGDDWPGNVRELEAVVKRAMVRRRRGWVRPEDIVLPNLRRRRLPDATRSPGIHLNPVQEQALQLKAAHGEVRRADLVARCRVSHEVARRALAGLARLVLLRRIGLGRATRYVSLSFCLTCLDDVVESVLAFV